MACPFALLVAVSDAHDRARTREPGEPHRERTDPSGSGLDEHALSLL
jgi:hypothetical protein